MLIKNLPKEIQEVVFERQKEQGNEPNIELNLSSGFELGNFDWIATIEGEDFWSKINHVDYSEFYKRYPRSEVINNYQIY